MKLRNKKTGEIIDGGFVLTYYDGIASNPQHSLAELNEEWEDYEEPKHDYYFIRDGGNIDCHWYQKPGEITERREQIGNYFETKEEAEKAVEKLKAWKRLKDKGFKFKGLCESVYELPAIEYDMNVDVSRDSQEYKDLDLLFGGEE